MRTSALLALLLPTVVLAAPVTLRIATAAPDGTAWAREFRAWSRDVELHTRGEVRIKWYFGAIAGDEIQVMDRIARGQVDGTASGGGLCQKLSPTLRALRVQGLLASHEEASWLTGRLARDIERELAAAGMVFLGGPVIGRELLWSTAPIPSLAALRATRLWRWDVDLAGVALSRAAGMRIEPRPLDAGARAFDEKELDAFLAIPSTVLAFQWIPRIRRVQDFAHGFLIGCLLVAPRAWERLTHDQQEIVRGDGVKAIARVDEVARTTDETLLGGVLARQGIVVEKTPAELRAALIEAMRGAPGKIDPPISDEMLRRLRALVDEHRRH